jgi:4-hydroxythreonine-4-phosphate dehydrogenase
MNAIKPLLITMGDPAGVGPELCLKALRKINFPEGIMPVIVGDLSALTKANEKFSLGCSLVTLQNLDDLSVDRMQMAVLPAGQLDLHKLELGKASAEGGAAALAAIDVATDACLAEQALAMVTAPVSKEAIEMSGVPFSGHTGHISKRCGDHDEMMMMSAIHQNLHIGYVTTHVSIAELPHVLSSELVLSRICESSRFAASLGLSSIALCGLNPHCGENGMMGDEEQTIIAPAMEKAKLMGIDCRGPFPADTLFIEDQRQQHDVILAMYHDQGGIPFKMLAFDDGVNHTLGLPIVRTSVDHGTAWPIAWKGVVREGSMVAAIELALKRGLSRLERS